MSKFVNSCIFVGVLVVTLIASGTADLECYNCRDCLEFTDAHLVTCSSLGEVTDPDEEDGDIVVNNGQVQMLEEYENGDADLLNENSRFVIDNSPLPGAPKFWGRGLKQYRNDDNHRCILVKYKENDEENIVRGCTTPYNNEDEKTLLCRQAIDGADHEITECDICDEDRCNAAVKVNISIITIITLIIFNISH